MPTADGHIAFFVIAALATAAASASPAVDDFKRMSLEELMDVEVYSASRRLEPTRAAPSAIFVLTGEDIRRARVTTIPDALRLVPGVQVGRVDANKWAVSIRGFNAREANKLLVLIDGRSIYDPLFSGVLWESHDLMLEDIDRIEVIRGPGGTLWGANAFNGVISIVSKRAADTQGALIAASAGSEERYSSALRYGWQPGNNQSARVYVKARANDTGYSPRVPAHDESQMARGGVRWDWQPTSADDVNVSAEAFDVDADIRESAIQVQDVKHDGHNVTTHWNHVIAPDNSLRAQLYYDHVSYESFGFDQERRTYDLELQQTVEPVKSHVLVWGAGYRDMCDETLSGLSGFVDVLPPRRNDTILNVFAQDTVAFLADRTHLTLGLKYEETDYAQAEWLPSVRFAWTPDASQTWWAAVADATRVPSRLESDLTFFGTLRLGDNFKAERVRAWELGHRRLIGAGIWYDVALFYNDYDDLRANEANGEALNRMHGNTRGFELALRWEPLAMLRLDLAYSYLDMRLALDATSTGNPAQPRRIEGLAPTHQVSLRTAYDLTSSIAIDATLRYVDELPTLAYPDYAELDLGLSWRTLQSLELSLVGQNLLHDHHPEQGFPFSATGLATEVERAVYGKATWQF